MMNCSHLVCRPWRAGLVFMVCVSLVCVAQTRSVRAADAQKTANNDPSAPPPVPDNAKDEGPGFFSKIGNMLGLSGYDYEDKAKTIMVMYSENAYPLFGIDSSVRTLKIKYPGKLTKASALRSTNVETVEVLNGHLVLKAPFPKMLRHVRVAGPHARVTSDVSWNLRITGSSEEQRFHLSDNIEVSFTHNATASSFGDVTSVELLGQGVRWAAVSLHALKTLKITDGATMLNAASALRTAKSLTSIELEAASLELPEDLSAVPLESITLRRGATIPSSHTSLASAHSLRSITVQASTLHLPPDMSRTKLSSLSVTNNGEVIGLGKAPLLKQLTLDGGAVEPAVGAETSIEALVLKNKATVRNAERSLQSWVNLQSVQVEAAVLTLPADMSKTKLAVVGVKRGGRVEGVGLAPSLTQLYIDASEVVLRDDLSRTPMETLVMDNGAKLTNSRVGLSKVQGLKELSVRRSVLEMDRTPLAALVSLTLADGGEVKGLGAVTALKSLILDGAELTLSQDQSDAPIEYLIMKNKARLPNSESVLRSWTRLQAITLSASELAVPENMSKCTLKTVRLMNKAALRGVGKVPLLETVYADDSVVELTGASASTPNLQTLTIKGQSQVRNSEAAQGVFGMLRTLVVEASVLALPRGVTYPQLTSVALAARAELRGLGRCPVLQTLELKDGCILELADPTSATALTELTMTNKAQLLNAHLALNSWTKLQKISLTNAELTIPSDMSGSALASVSLRAQSTLRGLGAAPALVELFVENSILEFATSAAAMPLQKVTLKQAKIVNGHHAQGMWSHIRTVELEATELVLPRGVACPELRSLTLANQAAVRGLGRSPALTSLSIGAGSVLELADHTASTAVEELRLTDKAQLLNAHLALGSWTKLQKISLNNAELTMPLDMSQTPLRVITLTNKATLLGLGAVPALEQLSMEDSTIEVAHSAARAGPLVLTLTKSQLRNANAAPGLWQQARGITVDRSELLLPHGVTCSELRSVSLRNQATLRGLGRSPALASLSIGAGSILELADHTAATAVEELRLTDKAQLLNAHLALGSWTKLQKIALSNAELTLPYDMSQTPLHVITLTNKAKLAGVGAIPALAELTVEASVVEVTHSAARAGPLVLTLTKQSQMQNSEQAPGLWGQVRKITLDSSALLLPYGFNPMQLQAVSLRNKAVLRGLGPAPALYQLTLDGAVLELANGFSTTAVEELILENQAQLVNSHMALGTWQQLKMIRLSNAELALPPDMSKTQLKTILMEKNSALMGLAIAPALETLHMDHSELRQPYALHQTGLRSLTLRNRSVMDNSRALLAGATMLTDLTVVDSSLELPDNMSYTRLERLTLRDGADLLNSHNGLKQAAALTTVTLDNAEVVLPSDLRGTRLAVLDMTNSAKIPNSEAALRSLTAMRQIRVTRGAVLRVPRGLLCPDMQGTGIILV